MAVQRRVQMYLFACELRDQALVNTNKLCVRALAFRGIRLVRNEDQVKACRSKRAKSLTDAFLQDELCSGTRRLPGFCVRIKNVPVQHSIAIEKDRSSAHIVPRLHLASGPCQL